MKILERKKLSVVGICPHCGSKLEVEKGDIWWTKDIDGGKSPCVTCAACGKGFDNNAHLWTIQDAKPGDVLYSKKHNLLWIYKNTNESVSCLNLNYSSNISIGTDIVMPNDTRPAPKEQRDTLLKAMADAGYSFDFEKKELKKLGQSEVTKTSDQEEIAEIPFGAKDSELQEVTYFIPKGFHAEIKGDRVVIVKGNQKPVEWSEEDEDLLKWTLGNLSELGQRFGKDYGKVGECMDWLESLKGRCNWKPSNEQIKALKHFVRSIGESGFASPHDNNTKLLYSLLEQLKKLREE